MSGLQTQVENTRQVLQTQEENTRQDYSLRYRTHVRTTDSDKEHTSGLQTQVENTYQDYKLR